MKTRLIGLLTFSRRSVDTNCVKCLTHGAGWREPGFVANVADQLYAVGMGLSANSPLAGMVDDLRLVLRVAQERQGQPSAVILDGCTLQSTCESGPRAGYDGYKRKPGSKVHVAVDTLGNLLAVLITPANEQERPQLTGLAGQVQLVTGQAVKPAFADLGCTGEEAAQAARTKVSNCKSSSCPRRKGALYCCRVAGASSAASAG